MLWCLPVLALLLPLSADARKLGMPDIAWAYLSNTQAHTKKSILLFFSVKAASSSMDLVKKNINHVRSALGNNSVDVYVAHYDLNASGWVEKDKTWYSENVQFSVEQKGQKFQIMQKVFRGFDYARYKWIWALDEDIDVTGADVPKMLLLANMSKADIVLPAFTQYGTRQTLANGQPSSALAYPHQAPNPACLFRYAKIVEVILPLLRPEALRVVLFDCERCIHTTSTWGLNRVWCSLVSRKLGVARGKTCAIIDQTPVVHLNFKTLDKWKHYDSYVAQAHLDAEDVKKAHPEDYVDVGPNENGDLATECVDQDGRAHSIIHGQLSH
jgi:hypothetical protein